MTVIKVLVTKVNYELFCDSKKDKSFPFSFLTSDGQIYSYLPGSRLSPYIRKPYKPKYKDSPFYVSADGTFFECSSLVRETGNVELNKI